MARGRQQKINREINWVTDEDGNVLGYMKDGKTLIPITELSESQLANPLIKGAAGVGNGKIYGEDGNEIPTGGVSKKISAKLSVVGIGDSIMAYGDGIGAGGSVPGPTSQSIVAWALSRLSTKMPYVITANLGVGGVTIDTVITNQLSSALIADADIIWDHSGINNINPLSDATLPTVAQVVAKKDYLISQASNVPLYILDAVTPLAATSSSGAFPRVADIPLINAGYKALAAKYPNVIYNDIYTPLAQDAVSGLAIAGVTVADGIHLSTYGADLAGKASRDNIEAGLAVFRRSLKPSRVVLAPRYSGTTGTKTPNSGTINGNIAAGHLCVINSATSSGVIVDAAVDDINNKQTIRIRNGNASMATVRMQLVSNAATGWASGDIAQASIRFNVLPGAVGLQRADFGVWSGGSPLFTALQKSNQETTPLFGSQTEPMELTATGTLASTPADINYVSSFDVASGGDVTIELSMLVIQEVVAA